VGERSSWGGRHCHNGGYYFPLEQCLPPEDILRGRHNSVTPAEPAVLTTMLRHQRKKYASRSSAAERCGSCGTAAARYVA